MQSVPASIRIPGLREWKHGPQKMKMIHKTNLYIKWNSYAGWMASAHICPVTLETATTYPRNQMKQKRIFLSTSLPNCRDSPSRIIKIHPSKQLPNGTLSIEQLRPSVIQTGHWEIIIFYPASVITFHRASTVNLNVLVILLRYCTSPLQQSLVILASPARLPPPASP